MVELRIDWGDAILSRYAAVLCCISRALSTERRAMFAALRHVSAGGFSATLACNRGFTAGLSEIDSEPACPTLTL